MRPGNASGQDQDRLLQGRQSQKKVSEYEIRLSRIYLSTTDREESQAKSSVCEFHTGGQRGGGQNDAANDPQTELPKSNGIEFGGYLSDVQSGLEGLVGVLREIFSLSDVSGPEALQHDVGGLGDEEVSTAKRP